MQPLILGHAAGTPLLGATWRPGGYRPRSPARTLLGRDLGRREAREVTDLVPVVHGAEYGPDERRGRVCHYLDGQGLPSLPRSGVD